MVLDHATRPERRRLMVDLRRATREIAAPHDLLVTSVEDFARNQDSPGATELEPARHGIVVHERSAA